MSASDESDVIVAQNLEEALRTTDLDALQRYQAHFRDTVGEADRERRRPWESSVMPPATFPQNDDAPLHSLRLEWVYGYRAQVPQYAVVPHYRYCFRWAGSYRPHVC